MFSMNVYATSGSIKQNSVIKCGSEYYGYHGNPKHWHIVKKEKGTWVVSSNNKVKEPSCYGDISNEIINVKLEKCIDGDTIKIKDNKGDIKTVRFLSIDTPELSHTNDEVKKYAKEASKYTCDLLEKASKIKLEFDRNSDREDKYGRLLAYVYADDTMLQKQLLKNGYAKVAYLYDDYKYNDELKKIEKNAKEQEKGIWQSNIHELMKKDENSKTTAKENDLWKIIGDFFKKIVSKILEYLESML